MSLPWFKANTARALAWRDLRIGEGRQATEAEAYAELMALLVVGRLQTMGLSTVATSLGWTRGRLRRRLAAWGTDVQQVNTTPPWWRTPPGEVEPTLSASGVQQTDTKRTPGEPSRARSFKEKEGEGESPPIPPKGGRAGQQDGLAWLTDHKPYTRRAVADLCLDIVEAIRGKRPRRASRTGCAPVLALWRGLGKPDPLEWLPEVLLVVKAAKECPHQLFARDIRGEGEDAMHDRSSAVGTLMVQRRWEDRLHEAQRWQDAGYPSTWAQPSASKDPPWLADWLAQDDAPDLRVVPGGE